jgi:FtsH-binding integral membrane protein
LKKNKNWLPLKKITETFFYIMAILSFFAYVALFFIFFIYELNVFFAIFVITGIMIICMAFATWMEKRRK